MFEKYLTKTGRLSTKQPQEVKNQWYIQKFQRVHGNKYDYSKVVYTCTKEQVEIVCREHGGFFQTPNSHLQGSGCPKCFLASKSSSTDKFIQQQQQIHGQLYEYSEVLYVHSHKEVLIRCKTHGIFHQQPRVHLQGKGCPNCQGNNPSILYLLKCNTTGLCKIGITSNLSNRVKSIGGELTYITHVVVDNTREHEKLLHSTYQSCNRFNPNVRNGGTEFFQLSQEQVQEVIHYLESVQQGEF